MRHTHRLIWVASMLLVGIMLSACTSPAGNGQSAFDSGIAGVTEAGPVCPVVNPTNPCPPKPVSRTVVVLDTNGNEVTRFNSTSDGTFHVPLLPGKYTRGVLRRSHRSR